MNPVVLNCRPERHAASGVRRLASTILLLLLVLAVAAPLIAQAPIRTGTTLRNLNLRSAPNLDSQVLVTLPDGADFTLLESSGEWIRVRSSADQEGWLYSPFVRLDPPRAPGTAASQAPAASTVPWAGVTLESLNLRSGPSTANPRLVLLPPRMRVEILEQRTDWLRVRAEGYEGWVAGEFVRITDTPTAPTSVEPPEEPVRISSSTPDAGRRIRELTTENSRLATELAESTARLVQADRERAALRNERDDLRSSLEALQTELTATRSALVEAAQATGESSDAQSELNSVRERLDRSQSRIEALEREISELQRERSGLQAQLESSASTAQQLEATAEVERAKQTQTQQDLEAAIDARDEANARIATLTGRIQELEAEKETADGAGADLRTELNRVQTERELADAEVSRLGSELERARAGTAQAEARAATLQGEVDALRNAAASQATETEQLENARQDLNRLIAERAAQEETLLAASTREEQLRGQLQTVGAELDAARLDVNRAVVALEELQAENERLRRDLDAETISSRPEPREMAPVTVPTAETSMPLEPLVPAAAPVGSTEGPVDEPVAPETPLLEPMTPAVAPEPAPTPVSETAPIATDPVVAASERVEAWRAAWSAADVDGYLDSYIDGYRPDASTSHASWRTTRRQRLSAPSFIDVRLGTLQVMESNPDRVVLRFEQVYESNSFSDRVVKTLTLVRTEDGDWRIATEAASPL